MLDLHRRRKAKGFKAAWLICSCALLQLLSGTARAGDYAKAPPPAWVEAVEPGVSADALLQQATSGAYYLLSDTQIRVVARDKERYNRYVAKALNANGVESIANIQIPFDPAYQKLTLHAIDVVRNGSVIHKLPDAKVRVLQRETELEYRIYDGSKTAHIFLDDVRVGDQVDYSYSVQGSNPVFGGAHFGSFDLQYAVPAGRIHARLLEPSAGHFAIVPHNTSAQPRVVEHDGYREHVWDSKDVPALTVEKDAPGWHDPYPTVQWSSYADWPAVVRWAQPLYQVPATLAPALQQEVARIARSESTPVGRALAALRLVQSDIRYLGVEVGAGSHAPNPPALVFERRFGDCKDKALLTLTLFDRLGIEAHAALVNTRVRRGLANWHATPMAFDHVIVMARIDGKRYWLDPTRSAQNSSLDRLYQPEYDLALPIEAGTRGLVEMQETHRTGVQRKVHATFDATAGLDKPVHFTVVTVTELGRAEALRDSLASSSIEDMQKQYLNYYARYYPGIKMLAPIEVKDDALNNRITTTERYDIHDIAVLSEKNQRQVVTISAPDIDDFLNDPATPVRKSPLGLIHPLDVVQETEVLLAEDWPMETEGAKIEDPAFVFERKIKASNRRLVIDDTLSLRAEEVAAADVPRYAANLAKARNETSYQLSWNAPGTKAAVVAAPRTNWLAVLVGLCALAFWFWLARIGYRYDPAIGDRTVDPSLQGLRGWLVLPGIGLAMTPLMMLFTMKATLEPFAMNTWDALTTPGTERYSALWAPMLFFELISNLGLIVFALLLASLFFQRRSSAPRFYIAFLLSSFGVQLVDVLLASQMPHAQLEPKDFSDLTRAGFSGAIWISYFLSSRRVQSTFVRRYRNADVAPAGQELTVATPALQEP